jgi:UDP-perosamine 4-acetyltransferase
MSRAEASIPSFPAIVGWGAGGHAKSVIDAIESLDRWKIVGLIDSDATRWGTTWASHPILGGEDKLVSLLADGVRHAFVGVGGAGNNVPRKLVFERLLEHEYQLPSVCHRSSIVSGSAQIGKGTVILAGAIVAAAARVSDNVIINSGAIVDHDCDIGAHSHISTGARLGGSVRVGEGAHVGIGATIRQGLTIGEHAVVGAGSVVIQDVPAGTTVVGSPARIIRQSTESV